MLKGSLRGIDSDCTFRKLGKSLESPEVEK